MAERVTKDTFEEKVLKSSLPVLIDFTQTVVFRARKCHRSLALSQTNRQKN